MTSKNGSLLRKFVLIALPFLIVWILLFINIRVIQRNRFIRNIISENELCAKDSNFLVSNYIEKIREDSKILAQTDAMYYLRNNPSEKSENDVLNMFEKYIINRKNYQRIRLFNYANNKVLNVEIISGHSVQKSSDYLDNVNSLEYINPKLLTTKSNPLISKLFFDQLDIQFHDHDNLYLRIYTPIFYADILSGVIEIDYDASDIINILKNVTEEGGVEGRLNLLIFNGDDDLSVLHNYQFNSAPQINLDNNELKNLLLPEIKNNSHGIIQNDKYLVAYLNLLPNSSDLNINGSEKWVVVNSFNLKEKFSFIPTSIKDFIFSYEGPSLFFVILLAFVIAEISDCLKFKNGEISIIRSIAKTTNDAVVIYDNETGLIYLNDSFNKITGYDFLEVKTKPNDFLLSKVNDSSCRDSVYQSLNEKGAWKGVIWSEMKNGIIYPAKLNIFKSNDKLNSNNHFVGIFADLTNSQFEDGDSTASVNYLMNLRNDELVKMISSCVQQGLNHFIMLYITIENYNYLMDIFNIKDIDLIETFVSLIRPIVNEKDIIAKIGKNQICVLLDAERVNDPISVYIEKFNTEISKIICINSKEIFYKTKIGASIFPEDTYDVSLLFHNTLIAHEWTNMNNQGNFAFFNKEMRENLYKEKKIFKNLKKAVERDELFIVYQPQIDIVTNKIVGMEALLRWNNSELGLISPAIFIPIAEKNHMMINLGKWITERTFTDLSYIYSQIDLSDNFRCAINISTMQLDDPLFLNHFYSNIDKNGLNYNNIEIEITENVFLTQINRINYIFQDIREKGITIAIDDFGTGYSSFLYLKQIPIDKIKIDRAFIKDYPSNDNGDLAKILVRVSKSLHKNVLVEGAETEEQIKFLAELGCDTIQGYYYSKPLMINNFIEFANNNLKEII